MAELLREVALAARTPTESSLASVHLPGVNRFVAVHPRHIPSKHAAQSLLPRFAGLLPPPPLCHLPGCPIRQAQTSAFDDVQKAADLGLVDFPLPKAIRRQWQQLADNQFSHMHLSDLRPVDLSIDAGAREGGV